MTRQISSVLCLADRHPRIVPAGPIFTRFCLHILDLVLPNAVVMDVWLAGLRVDIEANFHPAFSGADRVLITGFPKARKLSNAKFIHSKFPELPFQFTFACH